MFQKCGIKFLKWVLVGTLADKSTKTKQKPSISDNEGFELQVCLSLVNRILRKCC